MVGKDKSFAVYDDEAVEQYLQLLTEAERKGGHIARRRADGQLVLREIAQTPPEDEDSFRDFRHWRYYNTNNLWIDLRALSETLERSQGVLELPLIANHKTVDPRDSGSTKVMQLESAMDALREIGYDGWYCVEAFGDRLPELAAATKIWRRTYESEEQLARDAAAFVRSRL